MKTPRFGFTDGFILGVLFTLIFVTIAVLIVARTIDTNAAITYVQTVNPKLVEILKTAATPYEPSLYEKFRAWWNS